MMTEAEMQARKHELLERAGDLRERLHAINRDFAKGLDSDWEEQATQLENDEVLQEISRVTAEELVKVEQGIVRLQQAIEKVHSAP